MAHLRRSALAAAIALSTALAAPAMGAPTTGEHTGGAVSPAGAQRPLRQAERLDRAPVAVATPDGVHLSWRSLGTDPGSLAFRVYRDGERITRAPLRGATNLLDPEGGVDSTYVVTVVGHGPERPVTREFGVWSEPYLDIPLEKPAGGATPDGEEYGYVASDAGVGDLDGDGSYELVMLWNPTNAQDNSRAGHTGPVYVDALELDGTRLWRADLGRNIRAGAHYTQLVVYDLDGDGRSEVMTKTADGTLDGQGEVIGDPDADHRNADGYVLDGPEYLTAFEGATGAAIDTVDYVPARGDLAEWGDDYGNRADRFLAGVAHLDGERPSAVFSRGYYTRTVVAAWDLADGELRQRWVFDSDEAGEQYEGQGNHNLSVADVDGDHRDEIVFGSMTIDDDGSVLYSTGLGHGDAMHVSDLDPRRDGLEVFAVHESMETSGDRGATFRDAATGEVLWSIPATTDTGRGAAGDIDPRYAGAEAWAVGGEASWDSPEGFLMSADGTRIGDAIPAANFLTWWDGDLLREITDHDFDDEEGAGVPTVSEWDWESREEVELLRDEEVRTNNHTKGNPVLQADLLGDWREELVFRHEDSTALRLYTTTDLTDHRIHTLMHDPVYRLGVAWQNVAYNQPPHTGFYLGVGMAPPPRPAIDPVG
ncbi:rhamnogalacturonan lyase [Georgenia alba]|uniref:Rhamnogalacturonan lyase n=1 Tax=Georgenia alba TaxID=2233858 RepID=A0ABW2Q6W9_9MICO